MDVDEAPMLETLIERFFAGVEAEVDERKKRHRRPGVAPDDGR